jgi:phage tail-like protein
VSLLTSAPLAGHRFLATFLGGINKPPFDMRCQHISGLTSALKTEVITEGGENIFTNHRANTLQYDNLVIKRGLVLGSVLHREFDKIMAGFSSYSQDVLVTLLDDQYLPLTGWLLQQAYPVKWSLSDLNAEQPGILIDTLELAYARLQVLKV